MVPFVAIWIALDAIVLAVIAHRLNFDGLYGQDPYAYYDYGRQMKDLILSGHSLGYFYWPLGYPALVGGGFLLGGLHEAIAQTVTILFSAAGAAFSGLIAVEIGRALGFSARMAWIAGTLTWLLIAVAGQVIQSGIVIMSDMPGMAWAALSCWTLLRYVRSGHSRWLALAALALALATMTRWQYGGLALPWALYVIANKTIHWRHIALAGVVGIATLY